LLLFLRKGKGAKRKEQKAKKEQTIYHEDITGGSSTTNNGRRRGRRLWCSHLQRESTQKGRGSCCGERYQEEKEELVGC
jgi:hypothetical protein